ncbi:MAG: FAD-dependent oxidoreductase [Promethearchaeota archaeon]
MKETNVLVIGGGPAALISAVVSKQVNPNKVVTVVRNFPDVPVPCGIPYAFGELDGIEKDIMPDTAYKSNGIDLVIDEAIDGDLKEKIINLKSGESYKYEKLIIATGSNPVVPTFIKGYDKKNVYYIRKDNKYLKEIFEASKKAKNIVIIGAGFIGMEFADELLKQGDKNITIVEMLEHALIAAFDPEFCIEVEKRFEEAGINIMTKKKVVAIGGGDSAEYVELESGEKLDADLVLVSIGARPNIALAEKLGLKISNRAIWVDEYLRTSDPDVFAVGDCAAKIDFFTRRPSRIMLASTACSEARIAGANLYKLEVVRENKGTIGIFSTNLHGITVATAGLTETTAKREGFEVVTSVASSKDRHPGKISDANDIKVKLVISKYCGTLLGGQIIGGGKGGGEMINAIGVAIQQRMTISELFTLQIGTHPLLTSAPTTYPLIIAAQKILVELTKQK